MLKSYGCSICGKQAPKKYRAHKQFANRMSWLRRHRKSSHPTAHQASVRKGVRARSEQSWVK